MQTGTLLSYTKVWVPRADLPTPYTLGQIRLDDGVTVFAHVRELPEGVHVPMPMRLKVSPAGSPGPVFWFEPR